VVSVEITSKGRLNLHKFDEKLRAQMESYLVQLGILKDKQVFEPDRHTAPSKEFSRNLFE
jgi:hypothetical protein